MVEKMTKKEGFWTLRIDFKTDETTAKKVFTIIVPTIIGLFNRKFPKIKLVKINEFKPDTSPRKEGIQIIK